MNRKDEMELKVGEYILGLGDLGLKNEAAVVYVKFMDRHVRPLLFKQKDVLTKYERKHAPGEALEHAAEWTLDRDAGLACEARIFDLDEQIADQLEKLLEELKLIWLAHNATVLAREAEEAREEEF